MCSQSNEHNNRERDMNRMPIVKELACLLQHERFLDQGGEGRPRQQQVLRNRPGLDVCPDQSIDVGMYLPSQGSQFDKGRYGLRHVPGCVERLKAPVDGLGYLIPQRARG